MINNLKWLKIIKSILYEKTSILNWCYLERWLQAEIFTYFSENEINDYCILRSEISFITYNAKKSSSKYLDEKKKIYSKKADLIFISNTLDEMNWVELKVKNLNTGMDPSRSEKEIKKNCISEIITFLGFDNLEFCNQNYDLLKDEISCDFKLQFYINFCRKANHIFTLLFLNINNDFNNPIWNRKIILEEINIILKDLKNHNGISSNNILIDYYNNFFLNNSLMIVTFIPNK